MSKKEEMLRKKKMNRLHVATRGIESDLYRRHYTDLSKTMSAQLVIQNDTPYTLKFVRADLGDSCMWYEERSKISKTLASGDTFCAAIVENARSVSPVMRLYAKLVFRILDHGAQKCDVHDFDKTESRSIDVLVELHFRITEPFAYTERVTAAMWTISTLTWPPMPTTHFKDTHCSIFVVSSDLVTR